MHHSLPLMNSFNKTEAAVFSCRLCFLGAFPFISLMQIMCTTHISDVTIVFFPIFIFNYMLDFVYLLKKKSVFLDFISCIQRQVRNQLIVSAIKKGHTTKFCALVLLN